MRVSLILFGDKFQPLFIIVRQSQNDFFSLSDQDLAHVACHAAVELENLREKSLFITGGTGFFGKWLLAALRYADKEHDLGFHLTVLSRNPARFLEQHPAWASYRALKFREGNIANFSPGEDRYDYILHAAADTTAFTTSAEEQERSRTIVEGTRRALELARKSGTPRILYVSSGAVYGAAATKSVGASENDYATARALTPYGEAKRKAEELCETSGLDFVIARAFAFLGPHLPLDAHFAAGNFLRDAQRGGPVFVRGDGTAQRSYLYPADLMVWLLRILLQGQRTRAYNVGSDEAATTAQLARYIAEATSPMPEVTIQSIQPQGLQNIYLPNIHRARTELNLDVTIPLREAIARTIAFLNSD